MSVKQNEDSKLFRSEMVRCKYNTVITVIIEIQYANYGSERKRSLPLVREKGRLHGGDKDELKLME